MSFELDDVAQVVILDISTSHIGEYTHVRILEIKGSDILVSDAFGNEAWVTVDHLELVND